MVWVLVTTPRWALYHIQTSLYTVDPFILICESTPCAHKRLDCLGEQFPPNPLCSILHLADAFQFNVSSTTLSGLLQCSASPTEDIPILSHIQLTRARALGCRLALHRGCTDHLSSWLTPPLSFLSHFCCERLLGLPSPRTKTHTFFQWLYKGWMWASLRCLWRRAEYTWDCSEE